MDLEDSLILIENDKEEIGSFKIGISNGHGKIEYIARSYTQQVCENYSMVLVGSKKLKKITGQDEDKNQQRLGLIHDKNLVHYALQGIMVGKAREISSLTCIQVDDRTHSISALFQ